jgi:protein-tyrosine phosphatase
MRSILFVCTANICRSPMAEGLFRSIVKGRNVEWEVGSAGTWTTDGQPVSDGTRLVLEKRGISINEHKSRQVTADLLRSYQLILTMEQGQKEALRVEFPEIANRVYLMSEMIGHRFDVVDPIGGSQAEFNETARELDQILENGFDRIMDLTKG